MPGTACAMVRSKPVSCHTLKSARRSCSDAASTHKAACFSLLHVTDEAIQKQLVWISKEASLQQSKAGGEP